MKKNKHKNRLEKLIMRCVKKEIKPHWGVLWSQRSWCVPAYCGIVEGDGRQVVWLKTGDSRPNYYILRIDSKTDVESENFNVETLYCGVEDSFGNHDDYEQQYFGDELRVRYRYDSDSEWQPYSVCEFPALSTGNGAFWGTIKIF